MSHKDCSEVGRLLDEYASGELAGTAITVLDEHLSRCADCRQALRELLALNERIRALPPVTAPEGILDRVHAKLPEQRFGVDYRDTSPCAWLSTEATSGDVERVVRFYLIAA